MSVADPNSNGYESSLITYTSRGKTRQSVRSTSASCYTFLDFLRVAQHRRIDFLPIRWQPAMKKAGKGGTAKIHQGVASVEMTFAFKQMKRTYSPIEKALYLSALVAEITILGHNGIKRHNNVVKIEGICWDVDLREEIAWPVLVFEKAPYGDINEFMTSDIGRELDIEKRLSLLADVAHAVRDLHLAGVIHGDIKPENILIFPRVLRYDKWGPEGIIRDILRSKRVISIPKEEGCYVAKVTDFGYSSLFENENTSVRMPRSKPWTAPEWHEREFQPLQARKMDAYSFGMLCLWLLFYKNNSRPDCELEEVLEDANTQVLDHALGLVDTIACIDVKQKDSIQKIFRSTLIQKPTERTSDFCEILQLLSPDRSPALAEIIKNISIPEHDFHIYLSATQLIDAHFMVRNYIVNCFEEEYDRCSATPCVKLGLAFCYELGFGVERDPLKSQLFLDRSGSGPWIFKAMIESVKYAESETVEFSSTQFGGLHFEGFIPEFDPSQQYREEKLSTAAESQYRGEIDTIGYILGDSHVVVQKLRQQLAFLLESEGRWKDAEDVQLAVTLGASHINLQSALNLARLYWKQGRYTEAENWARRCVEFGESLWGEVHRKTQASNQLLASILTSQRKTREASETRERSIRIIKNMMGEDHPDTIASLEVHAVHGPWPQHVREQKLRQTLAMWISVVGKDHPNTLANMDHLAEALIDQGKYEESKVVHQQAYTLRELHLGKEHPDTLKSMSHLAWVENSEGKYEVAEKIQQQALELARVNLGEKHPEVLRRLVEAAHLRIRTGGYENAEQVHQQIMAKWELSAEHLDLLESIDSLGWELYVKGRYKKAEKVYRQAIMLKEKVFGKDTIHVTDSMNLLGSLFDRQGIYDEAEKIFRHTLAVRESILGKDDYRTGMSILGIVNTLQGQKRFGEAEEIARQTSHVV